MFQHIIKALYFSVICVTKTEIQISMQSWATCSPPIKVHKTHLADDAEEVVPRLGVTTRHPQCEPIEELSG